MNDESQGPGWWQASDGKWYPPEAAAGAPVSRPGTGGGPTVPTPSYEPRRPPPAKSKGFIRSLFDFKFDHFVTPKVLRFFYAVAVIVLSIAAVIVLVGGLASGESEGVVLVIVVPLGYIVGLVVLRMYFELIAAMFRIADDLRAIRQGKGY